MMRSQCERDKERQVSARDEQQKNNNSGFFAITPTDANISLLLAQALHELLGIDIFVNGRALGALIKA
jgi:hypothetical protein